MNLIIIESNNNNGESNKKIENTTGVGPLSSMAILMAHFNINGHTFELSIEFVFIFIYSYNYARVSK